MRLTGNIEGIEIQFDFYPPKHFRGIIPKQLDGKYVMQLKLIDNFGNETGGAYKYMYVDFSNLHFHILDENYKFAKQDEDKKYIKVDGLYRAKNIDSSYRFEKLASEFSYKEVSKCSCN